MHANQFMLKINPSSYGTIHDSLARSTVPVVLQYRSNHDPLPLYTVRYEDYVEYVYLVEKRGAQAQARNQQPLLLLPPLSESSDKQRVEAVKLTAGEARSNHRSLPCQYGASEEIRKTKLSLLVLLIAGPNASGFFPDLDHSRRTDAQAPTTVDA